MSYFNVNGIVLKRKNVAEYDKIVLIYTKELGKIKVIFKGVNKPKAKLLSLTESFVESELLIVKLKNRIYDAMFKAAGGQIIDFYEELRVNLERFIYANKIIEVVDALTLELAKDEEKFFLLKRVLSFMKSAKNIELIFISFIYRFIKVCGYKPNLKSCIKCGLKVDFLDNSLYFDLAGGGVLCNKCLDSINKNNIVAVDKSVIKIINMFYMLSAEDIDKLEVNKSSLENIKNLTFLYLNNYIHRPVAIL